MSDLQSDYPEEALEDSINNAYALAAADMNTSRHAQENVMFRNALQVELGELDPFIQNSHNGENKHISEARKERAEEKKRKKSKSVYDMQAHKPPATGTSSSVLGSNKNSRHYRNKLSREPQNHTADVSIFHSPPPIKSQRCNAGDDNGDDDVIFVSPPEARNDPLQTDVTKMKMAVVNKLCDLASPMSDKKKNALHKICNDDSVAVMVLTNAVQTKATADEAKTMLYNCL